MTDKLKLLKKMTTWATAVLVVLSIVVAIVCFVGSQKTVVGVRGYDYETQTDAAMIVYGIILLIGGIFGATFFYVFMLCVIDCFASINVTKAEAEQIAVASVSKSASDCKNNEMQNDKASSLT